MLDTKMEKTASKSMLSDQTPHFDEHWRRLCSEYLPLHARGSIWCYSRGWLPTDPHQGWKIHLSATILTACDVLQAVGTYLSKKKVAFKSVSTLDALARINSGLHHGYSQIGKFMTVYPSTQDAFCEIVEDLNRILPAKIAAPVIPFDFRYRESNIYYRYGSFIAKDNSQVMLQAPNGNLVPDCRNIPAPGWVRIPFAKPRQSPVSQTQSPFTSHYHVYRSLSQRGKGGVYEAVDTGSGSMRICIIKEGRRHGETGWDGRDGRSRVENEARVLAYLRGKGIDVPVVYHSFETDGNFYVVLEKIDGKDLQKLNTNRKRRLSLFETLGIGKQICRILADIHAAGWVWRDCKPANLFLTAQKTVRPVDFEGAGPIAQHDPFIWSSPNFAAPEVIGKQKGGRGHLPVAEDLYSLGATLFYLFEGRPPSRKDQCRHVAYNERSGRSVCAYETIDCAVSDGTYLMCKCDRHRIKFSRRVPSPLIQIISSLMSVEPELRPGAEAVFEALSLVERHLSQKQRKTRVVTDGIK